MIKIQHAKISKKSDFKIIVRDDLTLVPHIEFAVSGIKLSQKGKKMIKRFINSCFIVFMVLFKPIESSNKVKMWERYDLKGKR